MAAGTATIASSPRPLRSMRSSSAGASAPRRATIAALAAFSSSRPTAPRAAAGQCAPDPLRRSGAARLDKTGRAGSTTRYATEDTMTTITTLADLHTYLASTCGAYSDDLDAWAQIGRAHV